MDAREKRLAQNEALFREINERVRELAATHGEDEHVYTFFCECSNTDCTLQVELTTAAYETVRADPTRFVVAVGHQLPEIEHVVERHETWWVVQKEDDAAELARELDPRNGDD
jgi:hypothetical protein